MNEMLYTLRGAPVSAWIGICIVGLYAVLAIGAPVLAPYPEAASVGAQYQPWVAPHYLGTDTLGRDVLSRLIYGARNTVGIALATTALAFLLGATMGLLAATLGGWFDAISARVVDVLMAIPALICHRFFERRIDGLAVAMEEQAIRLVDAMHGDRLPPGDGGAGR